MLGYKRGDRILNGEMEWEEGGGGAARDVGLAA
jgi:hypothetical protein